MIEEICVGDICFSFERYAYICIKAEKIMYVTEHDESPDAGLEYSYCATTFVESFLVGDTEIYVRDEEPDIFRLFSCENNFVGKSE
jgi:hypothetical protein